MAKKLKPQFSIIVPALNEAKYIPKLLEDLSNQTFQDFEVIVVDGQSNDKTIEKVLEFKKKLPSLTILTSPKRHVCVQRNLGAKSANANTLIFSDADNRLPPYFLHGILYRLKSADADLLSTWFRPDVSNPTNDTIALGMNLALELQKNLSTPMFLESMIVVKKSAFIKIGGFNENIDFAEGRQFMTIAQKKGLSSVIVRDPIYYFSFRRFRKYGTLKLMKNTTALGLSNLLGQEFKNNISRDLYPMVGGNLFKKPKKDKNIFLKNISKILKEF
jgi:glycosyltransferase involved in cell wall biosynthesis